MNNYRIIPGETVELNNHKFEVIRELGAGMTAVVFLAKLDSGEEVALKVMRDDAGDEIRTLIKNEVENIQKVHQKSLEIFPSELPAAPKFFVANSSNPDIPFFIAMEYVEGKPLSDLIAEKGSLTEPEAFTFASEIGRILGLLHNDLGECYPDIKIENFLVVEDPEDKEKVVLRVLDWSILSKKDEEGIRRDLFFASYFSYQMFTGASPDYLLGQLQVPIDEAEKFNDLSFGTKSFFKRALHRTNSRRFGSIDEWMSVVQQMNTYWQQSGLELLNDAVGIRDQIRSGLEGELHSVAESQALVAKVDALKTVLDISVEKGEYNEALWKDLEEFEKGVSYLSRGQVSLFGNRFPEAIEYFKEGAELFPDQKQELLHWGWVAQGAYKLGIDKFRIVRDGLKEGLEAFLIEKYTLAEDKYQQVVDLLGTEGTALPQSIEYLVGEAKMANLYTHAHDKRKSREYDAALSAIQAAKNEFDKLPQDLQQLWVEEHGDLSEEIEKLKSEKATIGEASTQFEKAKTKFNQGFYQEAGYAYQQSAFRATEPEEVLQDWADVAAKLLLSGELQSANELLTPYQSAKIKPEGPEQTAYRLLSPASGYGFENIEKLIIICRSMIELRNLSKIDVDMFVSKLDSFQQQFGDTRFGVAPVVQESTIQAIRNAVTESKFETVNQLMKIVKMDLYSKSAQAEIGNTLGEKMELLAEDLVMISVAATTQSVVSRDGLDSREDVIAILESLMRILKRDMNMPVSEHSKMVLANILSDVEKAYTDLQNSLLQYQDSVSLIREKIEERIEKIAKNLDALLDSEASIYRDIRKEWLESAVAHLAEWELYEVGRETSERYLKYQNAIVPELLDMHVQDKVILFAGEKLESGEYRNASLMLENLNRLTGGGMREKNEKYISLRSRVDSVFEFQKRLQKIQKKDNIVSNEIIDNTVSKEIIDDTVSKEIIDDTVSNEIIDNNDSGDFQ